MIVLNNKNPKIPTKRPYFNQNVILSDESQYVNPISMTGRQTYVYCNFENKETSVEKMTHQHMERL